MVRHKKKQPGDPGCFHINRLSESEADRGLEAHALQGARVDKAAAEFRRRDHLFQVFLIRHVVGERGYGPTEKISKTLN